MSQVVREKIDLVKEEGRWWDEGLPVYGTSYKNQYNHNNHSAKLSANLDKTY